MERRARTRTSTSPGSAVVDIWKRQVGELSSINFARRLRASEDHVLRLNIFKKLHKHTGCVNTVSFSEDGDILISGSDDRMVILWDWQGGNVKLSFHSGHDKNVFQAKFMPYTDNRSIVTCGADGQVWSDIDDNSYDFFDVGSLITYDESEEDMEEVEDDENDADSFVDTDEGDDDSDYTSTDNEDEYDDDVSINTVDEDDLFYEPCDDDDDDGGDIP